MFQPQNKGSNLSILMNEMSIYARYGLYSNTYVCSCILLDKVWSLTESHSPVQGLLFNNIKYDIRFEIN